MDKLLLIDDNADMRYVFGRIFGPNDIELSTAASGEEGLRLFSKITPDLVIMDVRMGGIDGLETLRRLRQIDTKVPVIMMTAYNTAQTAIQAMKFGAYDYLVKGEEFNVPKLKQVVAAALKSARDMKEVVSYEPLLESEDYDVGIVGRSESMQSVFKLIGQLAGSDATALITGESGTGKELVARAIYHHSRRKEHPFLAINCAAIPENLLESELFGHEKGAFTGATTQRIGRFEQCDRGTIFLDEIGDMTSATQAKMLRVLQAGTFERVGGNQQIQADVRVIAATNRNLEQSVAKREFREDLFYRLNVVRIHMPSLRQRSEDIRLLVNYFLKKFAERQGRPPKSVAPAVLTALEQYHWPGNVRELENVIQRAMVVAKGDAIFLEDLPAELVRPAAAPHETGAGTPTPGVSPAAPGHEGDVAALAQSLFKWARANSKLKLIPAVERELIIQALNETRGNQVQAARLLGITRATLRKRVDKFQIRLELLIK